MKAKICIIQIARLMGGHKSTISRDMRLKSGCWAYRLKKARELAIECSEQSRNAFAIAPVVKVQTGALLRLQWSAEQFTSPLPVSHEALYQHGYAGKIQGGNHKQAIVSVVERKTGNAGMARV